MNLRDKIIVLTGIIIITSSIVYELNRELIDFRKGLISIATGIVLIVYPFVEKKIKDLLEKHGN